MSWATLVLSHDFCWSASMPVPILSYITAAARRGKEEVGLKQGCLPGPTPCTNTEAPLGACPKTFQAKRAGEAEQRSRGQEEEWQLLWHAEQLSGMVRFRCLVPWYSSETWTRLDFTKINPMRSLVQRTVEMIIPLAESAGGFASLWSCHSCSSFLSFCSASKPALTDSSKGQPSPLAFLLACCSLLSLSFNTARTNYEKPFLFKLQEGLLSSFLYKEVSSRFHLPVNCTTFLDSWCCPFLMRFVSIPHEATSCRPDHVSELGTPLRPWPSPSRSGVTQCLPGTQQSFSSLVLTALTSVSHSWKEMGWHLGPV